MKTAMWATAILAAAIHMGVQAQGTATKAKAKEPGVTAKQKELTAEQKLNSLPPEKRAEFEAAARKLGIDPLALAAKDHAAATQQLQVKSSALAQITQGSGKVAAGIGAGSVAGSGSVAAASSRDAKQAEADALRQQAQSSQSKQAASAQEDYIKQQQDAMRQIQEVLKAMNDQQQTAVRNMR